VYVYVRVRRLVQLSLCQSTSPAPYISSPSPVNAAHHEPGSLNNIVYHLCSQINKSAARWEEDWKNLFSLLGCDQVVYETEHLALMLWNIERDSWCQCNRLFYKELACHQGEVGDLIGFIFTEWIWSKTNQNCFEEGYIFSILHYLMAFWDCCVIISCWSSGSYSVPGGLWLAVYGKQNVFANTDGGLVVEEITQCLMGYVYWTTLLSHNVVFKNIITSLI